MSRDFVTLYRPVGSKELARIESSGGKMFPPRFPEQPIFYPVTNDACARQIARDWNTKTTDDGLGHVVRFSVKAEHMALCVRKVVGGCKQEELWVPAEALDAFNAAIVGRIEKTATFSKDGRS